MISDCIFCSIVSGKLPCNEILSTEYSIVFEDIEPTEDIHWLVIPKQHFENIFDIDEQCLIYMIKDIKQKVLPLLQYNCKIIINNGKIAGQEINHLHFHIISKKVSNL